MLQRAPAVASRRRAMMSTRRKRELFTGVSFLAVAIALVAIEVMLDRRAAAEGNGVQAPMFEVDPYWPKPLPHSWTTGNAIGIAVDAKDQVWMIHRTSGVNDNFKAPGSTCCTVAPPILGFNQAGDVIGSWGGPGEGYTWPDSNHGLWIDAQGNFWIGGNGDKDTQILKFTSSGKFLLQIGTHGVHNGSNDTANMWKPTDGSVDKVAHEVYVGDGYGNKRVIVFDSENGKYKRHWGAYGNKPDDTNNGPYDPAAPPLKQFRSPVHCAEISNDNLIYACDRQNDRIQVFKTDGTFVKEGFVAKETRKDGSAWDVAFSRDPQQKYLYLADGGNHNVHVLLRDTLEELTTIGSGGRLPGQFYGTHNVATDSRGNLYVAETYAGRIQKFVYKGLGPVSKKDQGVLWPKSRKS
jgi:DNA-binding beta-propeller fold protein YncE